MGKIRSLVAVCTIPIIISLFTLDLVAFNEKYYPKAFEKYDVYSTIDATQEEIDAQALNVLRYIQNEEQLGGNLLNEKEKRHLADVQTLVIRGQQFLLIGMFIFLATWLPAENKRKIIVSGCCITLGIILILSLISFTNVFLLFHKLAFINDLWLLNPVTDNLIKMYPQEIFHDIVKTSIGQTAGIAGILLVVSILHRWKRN